MSVLALTLVLALQSPQAPDEALELQQVVRPEMPRAAERRGITGYVVVRYSVSEDGRVTDLEVEDSEPRGVFDMPALRAVAQWRYEPPGRRVDDLKIRFDFG